MPADEPCLKSTASDAVDGSSHRRVSAMKRAADEAS